MTDELLPGLGWIESPPDERDWPIDALYAATGAEPPAELPAAYHVPAPLYPVVDQGSSPMCVAYSAAGEQGRYDLRDTGLALFDEALFFRQIGGGKAGAVIRDALNARLSRGYPPTGHPDQAASHRIAAYYSVPVTRADLCAAILSFGPLVIGTPWASAWFHPRADGTLPPFDRGVGGHAILAVGWDAVGLRLRNSWGADWGQAGEATLPWGELGRVREAWKAVDRIEPRPRASWSIRVAHGATVVHYALDAHGRLTDTRRYPWTGRASSGPCGQPAVKRGASSGQATVAHVTAGLFRGRWVRIGAGVTAASTTAASAEED